MQHPYNPLEKNSVFIVKSSLYITLLMLFFLLPFSVNNFFQGRLELGFGSLAIIILCTINAWNCYKKNYQPLIILTGIVPFIIVFLVLSFREQGIIGVFWSYPAALMFYFMLTGRYAWLANTLLIALVVPEAWKFLDTALAVRFAVTLTATSLLAGIFIWFITKQQYKLTVMTITDPLTKLYNRAELDNVINQAIEKYQQDKTPVTMMMLDLDHFKSINDTLGHYTGDDVLRGVGAYFLETMQGVHKVFRIGGEEFIVLMADTTVDIAKVAAEKVREEISVLELIPDRQVTTSIGVSQLAADDNLSSWMKRCDASLYQAKVAGRNQVVVG